MTKIHLTVLCLLLSFVLKAQRIGGDGSFHFVNLLENAHINGIGAQNVSLDDRDINLFWSNPAMLKDTMHNFFSLSYTPFFADIKSTNLSYARNIGNAGIFAAGLKYTGYGSFQETDATGQELGTFNANDFVFVVSHASMIERYTIGATAKFASTKVEDYNATALLFDLGGLYRSENERFTIGMAMKNFGAVLSHYTDAKNTELPFDIQVGASYKLEHMPFRASVTYHHLNEFDIVTRTEEETTEFDQNGNIVEKKVAFGDKLMRHFVIGGEFLLSKNFQLRFGYNILRRQELRARSKSGGAGFSVGGMIRIKSFELSITRAWYHVAGGRTFITLTTNFNTLFKKKVSKGTNTDLVPQETN